MNVILVTSRGLTATTWFANALNLHPDIFCAHGRDRPSRGFESPKLLADRIYRQDRLQYEQWQRNASVAEYISDLANAAAGSRMIANIHGYILIELFNKLDSTIKGKVNIANMVRHPISFIQSYVALLEHRELDYPEKFATEHAQRARDNKQLFLQLKIDPTDITLYGFVEACQALIKSANEQQTYPVETIQMEKLVSDPNYFRKIFQYLTESKLAISEEYLTQVFSTQKLNSHFSDCATPNSRNNETKEKSIWDNWSNLQRHVFHSLIDRQTLIAFTQLGYDLSYCIRATDVA